MPMKQMILLAATILATATPAIAQRGMPQGEAIPANCPLKVEFGSYAMGIDRGAFDAISRLFERDRGVRRVVSQRWGREGEVTLCALTRSPADARRLGQRARALVPARPRGPVTISGRGVKPYHSPAPTRR